MMLHYVFVTPEGRPLLARMLCDLAGVDGGCAGRLEVGRRSVEAVDLSGERGTAWWGDVTCPACLDTGPETVAALLALPDAALISLGAQRLLVGH